MRLVGLCLSLLAGCDYLIGLQERPPVDATTTSPLCSPAPTPGLDADEDGVVNELDACPFVAHQRTDDEDADTIPDQCDLCPQIAGDLAAGDDPDCDGIGAACDPDSTIPHVRTFYGLASKADLVTENINPLGSALRIVLDTTTTWGEARFPSKVSPAATYETQFTIRNGNVLNYAEVTLKFVQPAPGKRYNVGLVKLEDNSMSLNIESTDPALVIKAVPIGNAATNLTVKLRVVIDTTSITGYLSLNDGVPTIASAPVTLAPTIDFGIDVYRQANASAMTVDVEYLSRIGVAP